MGALRLVVGIFGNVAAIFLFSAPILTFKRIIRNKSTEEFSCIPYVISLLTCVVYTWYASPVLTFIMIYLCFAPAKEKVKITSMTLLVTVLSILVVIITIFAYEDHHHRNIIVGSIAVVTASVMYGSPLVAVKTVIETKSVEFMPFYLSFFTFLTSGLWSIYGLLDFDFFIATPNLIGTLLGIIQLVLYFKYRERALKEKSKSSDVEKNEDKTVVELQPDAKNSTVEA
ncbi:hypothetical protein K2173_008691 [Erythroxylum novogranatense]|uniref:Bidirectional sugar transporter SWEET n=1 Tax=Erythroxylum novogranatense TaxID=1862640 RepID=A0AAV8SLR9_9ROSI|nr:hypothetical protein K2173_008691 [Erythroxylum novogranatense]